MITSTRATIVCLQETKLDEVDGMVIRETMRPNFIQNYSFLAAIRTRGGIIIAADERYFNLISSWATQNTITVVIRMLNEGEEWTITTVYGPQRKRHKR